MSDETPTFRPRIDPQELNRPVMPAATPRPIDAQQIKGNMPPAMQALLMQAQAQAEAEESEAEPMPVPPQPVMPQVPQQLAQRPTTPAAPQGFETNNAALSDLLAGIQQGTNHYEQVRLPSLGKFYTGPNVPTDGIMYIRPMTGREEQILYSAKHIKRGTSFSAILKNCSRNPIDPDKLLSVDRTYLMVYLRGISYGQFYEPSYKCVECGNVFEYRINLNTDLSTTYCPETLSEQDLCETLPICGYKFWYRLPTNKDEMDISEYQDRRNRHFPDADDDTFFYRASLLIKEITNNTSSISDSNSIKLLLQSMVTADVNHVRNTLVDPPFGVNTETKVICSHCLEQFNADLPMELGFFFPKKKAVEE